MCGHCHNRSDKIHIFRKIYDGMVKLILIQKCLNDIYDWSNAKIWFQNQSWKNMKMKNIYYLILTEHFQTKISPHIYWHPYTHFRSYKCTTGKMAKVHCCWAVVGWEIGSLEYPLLRTWVAAHREQWKWSMATGIVTLSSTDVKTRTEKFGYIFYWHFENKSNYLLAVAFAPKHLSTIKLICAVD